MLDLPRSARLVAWAAQVGAGAPIPPALITAVTGTDEPHTVALAPEGPSELPESRSGAAQGSPAGTFQTPANDLGTLLGALRADGFTHFRLVLPVPGDVAGLPGPASFNAAALEAGEAVVAHRPGPFPGGPSSAAVAGPGAPFGWGLVPEITRFGSALEPGALVCWSVHPVGEHRVPRFADLGEAEEQVALALREAAAELAALDVARWRPEAAERLADLRSGQLPRWALPPGLPGPVVRLITQALRLRALVALAAEDDGGAVDGHGTRRRRELLRDLDSVCRAAVATALSAAATTVDGAARDGSGPSASRPRLRTDQDRASR